MRLTRTGWALLAVGAATVVTGRTVQVAQVWMIGVSLIAAAVLGGVAVALRPSRLTVTRSIEPTEIEVGDTAHMALAIVLPSPRGAAPTVLDVDGRRLGLPSLRAGTSTQVILELPTDRRGVQELGPVTLHRRDPLDLVRRSIVVCSPIDVVIAPRTVPLEMARLGVGALGSMLIQRARQFGVSEFEGLRHYVEGDDLRLVHWKASARSTDLLVKQFSLEGSRRCTVILDTSSPQTDDEFELAVSTAASLVRAGHQADLSVRLATTGGVDLRAGTGLDVMARALAVVTTQTHDSLPARDASEGLGLVVCVTPDLSSRLWQQRDQFADPLLVTIAVTRRGDRGTGVVDAASLDEFAAAWNAFVGTGSPR